MAKGYVNLDALIIREDLHTKPEGTVPPSSKSKGIKVTDLLGDSFLFQSLRKPDFQRETASWEPEKVVDLVQCFLKGDFVPSIILWYSQDGKTFVIDGAHRLSALIAWVLDDYGDKHTSKDFFNGFIPPEQQKIADLTRQLMKDRVGSYEDIKNASKHPEHASQTLVRFARNAGNLDFHIQWVEGDQDTAESSFKKINQKATLIDPTEFQMIESRRKPNAIAARALIRAGTGHKFWGGIPKDAQNEIESIAKEIYEMLFVPPLESPIKTLDLPVAGKGYSHESVKLIFDFVNLVNGLIVSQSKLKAVPDDIDGKSTIEYLKKIRRIISMLCSGSIGSLGLHPAVYFYSAVGRYQPTAFLATIRLITEIDEQDQLPWFTERRSKFEDFLVSHRHFINQIVSQFGSGIKGYEWVFKLYKEILENIDRANEGELVTTLINADKWRLKDEQGRGAPFGTETKSAIYLKSALSGANRCGVCGARMHKNSLTSGHKHRREDGGLSHSDNGQLEHPYCNSGYKEKMASLQKKQATPQPSA